MSETAPYFETANDRKRVQSISIVSIHQPVPTSLLGVGNPHHPPASLVVRCTNTLGNP